MLVIGSTALSQYNPDRVAKDLDIVSFNRHVPYIINHLHLDYIRTNNTGEIKQYRKRETKQLVEVHIADSNEAWSYLLKELKADNRDYCLAPKDVLFSIKKSHIHHPIKFEKHIADYVWLLENGATDKYPEFTKLNEKKTKQRTPKLNKTVEEFFDDNVLKFFVHDDIHKVMAHEPNTPAYTLMQQNNGTVRCYKVLWDIMTREQKLNCVLEEAYVIALERKLIPHIYASKPFVSTDDALKWAMMRICTNLTSGWFREFATNNYFNVLKIAAKDYYKKFFAAVSNKEILQLSNSIEVPESKLIESGRVEGTNER